MEARFKSAQCSYDMDGNLLVTFKVERDYIAPVRKFVAEMQDRLYTLTAKVYRKKRSLDANAYYWVLAGKLAAVLGISPEEVYRNHIPNVAGNSVIHPIPADDLERWDKWWCAGHLGRITEDMGPCRKTEGYHNVRCYIGSSDYDTAQMSRLIDLIVNDCKEQGIETMTPRELAALKEEWGQ